MQSKLAMPAILILLLFSTSLAATPAQFYSHADTVIDRLARFDPVWATKTGIHAFDSLLADYSPKNVRDFIAYLNGEEKYLSQIDTAGWTIDQKIDLRLLTANIKSWHFDLEMFPYWKKAPYVYSDQCLNGIYYLALRDFAPMPDKLPSLMGRLRRIPDICRIGKANLTDPVPIFIEMTIEAIDEGIALIKDVSNTYADSFADHSAQIIVARDSAIASLRDFNAHIVTLKDGATGSAAIGRENLEFMLRRIHLLNIGPDSLLRLGENIYVWADSQMKATQLPPIDTTARFPLPSLSKKDILDYYQWEINKVRDFVIQKRIANLSSGLGSCVPVETPAFLRGVIRGIAYEPPGPFDKNQTGYFYVRPLPDTFSAEQRANNFDYIHRRGFRGSVVHEAFPGHHMQLLLANQHSSKIRQMQQNLILIEGWALYCEEMAYEQGLFNEAPRQWHGILGGIRFRAVRIIVDIGLHTGTLTPETAMTLMNEKLGENPFYYTAEIRRYSAYPTSALSYLTGKTLIMAMRRQAMQREGESFKLGEFHDRLLSEGSIPPALIAEKYGWTSPSRTAPQ
jgi:uncharacterized protein (DUF885 family)